MNLGPLTPHRITVTPLHEGFGEPGPNCGTCEGFGPWLVREALRRAGVAGDVQSCQVSDECEKIEAISKRRGRCGALVTGVAYADTPEGRARIGTFSFQAANTREVTWEPLDSK